MIFHYSFYYPGCCYYEPRKWNRKYLACLVSSKCFKLFSPKKTYHLCATPTTKTELEKYQRLIPESESGERNKGDHTFGRNQTISPAYSIHGLVYEDNRSRPRSPSWPADRQSKPTSAQLLGGNGEGGLPCVEALCKGVLGKFLIAKSVHMSACRKELLGVHSCCPYSRIKIYFHFLNSGHCKP